MGAHTAALQPADSDDDDDDDGDDSQSTAATPTTTSTAPHTAGDAAADTTCEVFRGTARGVRAGTLRTCALLRELREPRCWTRVQCAAVATSPW